MSDASFESSSSSGSFSTSSSASSTPRQEKAPMMMTEEQKKQKIQQELAKVLATGAWKAVKDAKGRQYYYNTLTLKTTWDLAKELNLDSSSNSNADTKSKGGTTVANRKTKNNNDGSSSTTSEEDEAETLRKMKQWGNSSGANFSSPPTSSRGARENNDVQSQRSANNNNTNNNPNMGASKQSSSVLQFRTSGAFGQDDEQRGGGDGMNEDKPFSAFGNDDDDGGQEGFEQSSDDEDDGHKKRSGEKPPQASTPSTARRQTLEESTNSGVSPPTGKRSGSFSRQHVAGTAEEDQQNIDNKKQQPIPKLFNNTDVSPFSNPSSTYGSSSSSSSSFETSSSSSSRSNNKGGDDEFEKSTPSDKGHHHHHQKEKKINAQTKLKLDDPNDNNKNVSPAPTNSSAFSEPPPVTPATDLEAIAAEIKKSKFDQLDQKAEAAERQKLAVGLNQPQGQQQQATTVVAATTQPSPVTTNNNNNNNNNFSNLGAALLAIGRGQDPSTVGVGVSVDGNKSNPLQRPTAEQLISVNNTATSRLIDQSRNNLLLPSQQYELAQKEALDLRTKSEALRNLAEAYTALVTRRTSSEDDFAYRSSASSRSGGQKLSPMDILLQQRKRQSVENQKKQQIVDALRTVLTHKELGIEEEDENDDPLSADQNQTREQKLRQRLRQQLYADVNVENTNDNKTNNSRVLYQDVQKDTRRKPLRLASILLLPQQQQDATAAPSASTNNTNKNSKEYASTEELSNDAILDLVVQMAVSELPKKNSNKNKSGKSHIDPNDELGDNIVISASGFVKSKSLKVTANNNKTNANDDSTNSIPSPTQCVQDMFKQNLNNHIVAPMKRHILSSNKSASVSSSSLIPTATPQEVASVQRFVLSSVAKMITDLLRHILEDERNDSTTNKMLLSSPRLPSATYFIKYTGPSAQNSTDGKRLRHMVYRTLHCLPFEVHPVVPLSSASSSLSSSREKVYEPASHLIRNKAELVEASKKSDFFRLEAWVTSSHLLDASAAILEAISSIEHFMADGYQPFNFVAPKQQQRNNHKNASDVKNNTNANTAEDNNDLLYGLVLLPDTPLLELYRRTDREFVPARLANKNYNGQKKPLSTSNEANKNGMATAAAADPTVINKKTTFNDTAARLHLKNTESIEQVAFLTASLTKELEEETLPEEDPSEDDDENDSSSTQASTNDNKYIIKEDENIDPKKNYEKMIAQQQLLKNKKKNNNTNPLSERELREMREGIVASTLEDLLDDDNIRAAVMRKCKSKFETMMKEHEEDPNKKRLRETENKVDLMVQQMKKEILEEDF